MRPAGGHRGDVARAAGAPARRAARRATSRCLSLAIVVLVLGACAERDGGAEGGRFAQESTQERGALRVRVSLDRDTITIVEGVRLRLDVSVEAGYRVEFPELGGVLSGESAGEDVASPPGDLGSFTIADVERTGARLARNGRIESSLTLTLEAYLPGEHEIPEIRVAARAIEGGEVLEIRTRAMAVSVASVLESEDLALAPLRDVVDPSVEFRVPIGGIVAAGVIGCALIAGIVLIGKRLIMAPTEVGPVEAARERLETIVKRSFEDPREREASLREASVLLRQCLAHRADPRATSMGDEALARAMPRWNALDAREQGGLLSIVRELDGALYSGESPSAGRTREIIRGVIEQLAVIDRVGMRFALADRGEESDTGMTESDPDAGRTGASHESIGLDVSRAGVSSEAKP